MTEEQPLITVGLDELLPKVKELHDEGWRLIQIGITNVGTNVEINYSFDKELKFLNLRLTVPGGPTKIPSVSGIYWCAFLYENEMHDLFGVEPQGMAIDFKGNFYKTRVKFPFLCAPIPLEETPADKTPAQPATT